MTRPFRLADIYALREVSDPAVSPDGSRVAFVVHGARKVENDRWQNLWLAATDGSSEPHRLTRGFTSDSSPAWSPCGRYLAFLSTREHELEVKAALAEEREEKEKAKEKDRDGDGAGAGEEGPGPDEEEEKPKAQIWVLDLGLGGEPRQLTRREEGVEEFDWSPDGRHIVFSSRDPDERQKEYLRSIRGQGKVKDDRGPLVIDRVQHKHDKSGYLDDVRTHLFVIDVATREERRLTDGPCDETAPRWSPCGDWILFVSNRTGDPDNNLRDDLWLIRPDGSEVRRLTFGDLAAGTVGPRWSPDGRHVAFVSPLEPENGYVLRHLMCVAVDRAEPVDDLAACVGQGWSTVGGVVPDAPGDTPDPVRRARAYPVPLRRTPVRVLTEGLDRPAFYCPPVWTGPEEILFLLSDRGQTKLAVASLGAAPERGPERGPEPLAEGATPGEPGEAAARVAAPGPAARAVFPKEDRLCTLWSLDAAGGTVVVGLDRPETGLDLYALKAADLLGAPDLLEAPDLGHAADAGGGAGAVRLTAFNETLFSERDTARYKRMEFRNSDGEVVEALVAFPPGMEPEGGSAEGGRQARADSAEGVPAADAGSVEGARPAPLLVHIHGGPMWYDSPGFRFDEQYWAGLGYVVLMVNYRGSTSYGEAFCRAIQGDWGPREHDDVMSGIDEVIRRGWADPERLFCTGFSQGGIMTNWAVGHTDRFRAAVSEHGMWDYVAAYGTDDCHLWWQDDLGVPWQNPDQYRRISPMSGVEAIRTPLLIMAGELDWRCPLSQSEQLYLALKKRGIPTQLVIYQGERHAITKPKRAIDRIRRICRWLARYGGRPFDDDSAEGYPDPGGAGKG